MIAARKNIKPKVKPKISNPEDKELYETIEFEVNGRIVNRVKKKKSEMNDRLNDFFAQYGRYGQAYIIRESKMNFQSLLD